jgi:hypothetical protein
VDGLTVVQFPNGKIANTARKRHLEWLKMVVEQKTLEIRCAAEDKKKRKRHSFLLFPRLFILDMFSGNICVIT